jgi:hypothetical protein
MELETLYESYWQVHNEKLAEASPLEVAAILVSQALTIYRTVLDEEEYDDIVDRISDMRGQIKKINIEKDMFQ